MSQVPLLTEGFTDRPPEVPTPRIQLNQPPFLTSNWRHLQAPASYSGSYKQYVKVDQGVITLNNGRLIIRFFGNCPDGWYIIDDGGGLVAENPLLRHTWREFPDVNLLRPNFQGMNRVLMRPEDVRIAIDFCNEIRACNELSEDSSEILIDDRSMVETRTRRDQPQRELGFGGPLPIRGHGSVFQALHLKIALTEMLRYPEGVYMAYDNTPDMTARTKPLFLGRDWGHCSLVFPRSYSNFD